MSAIAINMPWYMYLINALGTNLPWVMIVLLFVVLIISVFGNIGIDFKGKKFTFGNNKSPKIDKKRSCGDCIMLLLGKRIIFESNYNTMKSNILRDQMIFAEHKIQEAKYLLMESYQEHIEYYREKIEPYRESIEYLIYQECITNALHNAKDEIRRSFKENGFHQLDEKEFKSYISEKRQTLITITRDYLRRTYPASGMIVSLNDRFKKLDSRGIGEIENLVTDIYINAKHVRKKIEENIIDLQANFIQDIDKLVGEKNASL